ncbi:zinc finger, CCHC-type containing protein [Tanacetum coccineum]|uniref:Zinc finger, CCHC-type containing protein n=1 Tax=Tanacetum coccineum TaxID=301880 RepID=A0ABQ4Y5W8_9ASTR
MVSSPAVYEHVEATVNTPVGVASVIQECVTPSVDDMMAEMEKKGSLDDTIVLGSFPLVSTLRTTTTDNALGKFSYVNVTGKPSGKKLNFHALLTPGGNGMDVVVPVESIRAISKQFANTSYGFFLGSMDEFDAMLENGPRFIRNNSLILKKWNPNENLLKEDVSTILVWVKLHGVPVTAFSEDSLSAIATKLCTPLMLDSYTSDMCMQSWGRSSYTRALIKLRADVELKDNIMVAMPKITREGQYTYNNHVEYEWKPPRCASCKVFGHIHEECLKNTGAGEIKTLKKPSQTSRGMVPSIKVSNSNPFEVLNLVDNDVKLGIDGGTTNLVNNEATSSGSFFMNINNSSTRTTPIIDKIRKFKELLTSGKATLVDEAGIPLKKVEFLDDYDSEDEVALVDNDMARSIALERVGFGTQSLLEQ